ncbi:Hypothetical protein GbCGDNIH2_8115 [Granulibacter bethesdensis]|nr:Hypothetical protein GbCGDNIH2_8115 [Granulibacter bethesdensis]
MDLHRITWRIHHPGHLCEQFLLHCLLVTFLSGSLAQNAGHHAKVAYGQHFIFHCSLPFSPAARCDWVRLLSHSFRLCVHPFVKIYEANFLIIQ